MNALDTLGYCVVRPGARDQLVFPLMPGSAWSAPRGFAIPSLASNVYGPVNALQGIREPTIAVRTRAFPYWFNALTLNQMVRRGNDGAILGRTVTGAFAGSFGPVQWKYAAEDAVEYAACKIGVIVLAWDGADRPVECQFTLRAYGRRQSPTPFRFLPPAGRPYSGATMAFGGITGVWSGALRIDNRLVGNPSAPHFASADGDLYMVDYACGNPIVTLELGQATGAVALDSPFSDGIGQTLVTFFDPTQSFVTRARIQVISPDKVQTVRIGNGRIRRIYRAQKANASSALMRFF